MSLVHEPVRTQSSGQVPLPSLLTSPHPSRGMASEAIPPESPDFPKSAFDTLPELSDSLWTSPTNAEIYSQLIQFY